MADDRPEDIGPSPDSGRAKRAPPTIDLEATEVSGDADSTGAAEESEPTSPRCSVAAISAAVIAAVSGAGAAALVIAVAWLAGWPQVPPPAAPQVNSAVNSAAVDDLAVRIAGIESRISKPAVAAPDPAAAARAEALEKSLAALRSELASQRAQSEKLASAINDAKSAPREAAPSVDLSAINERIAQIERAARAQSAAIAQESSKPADDVPLRRIVAAALLDVLVRIGDPYPAALVAAKSLAANPEALKPLEGFAASGVPNAASLSRELLTLVPKLSPPAPESSTTGTGIVDRLQAGAAKLVRIERTDAAGTDRGAVVARVTAAALRNDFSEARRELKTLAPGDRAAAQAWLEKADARDAALAASRQFAADAMAALAKPAQ
ncbi:hypothetical protein KMZ29_01435 [Bradyrhizobium sediminis]|uniref:Mitochondrial inner membrane protein n=1 Tax=Bradyrhizobium sediminis TaxID=2840469 RepID=A0A975NE47_9BRAD|nr:hypothetical protein [Bradyrhizobium sediminis]QWG13443.1 hypothetical protein KMZ29_01435 [Bradyrhizobium sediminis]